MSRADGPAEQRGQRLAGRGQRPVHRRAVAPVRRRPGHRVAQPGQGRRGGGVRVVAGDGHPAVGGVAEVVGRAERRHQRERRDGQQAGRQQQAGRRPPAPPPAASVQARLAVPAAMAAAARATTACGAGCAASDQGGWPGPPGSAGSISEGPAPATANVSAALSAPAASPARPSAAGRGPDQRAGSAAGRARGGRPGREPRAGARGSPARGPRGPGPRRPSCRARCTWDRQSLPVARWASGTSTSVTRRPFRIRSMVRPVSAPRARRRAAGPPRTRPGSGSAARSAAGLGRQPVARSMPAPDSRHDQAVPALADPAAEHRDGHVGGAAADRLGERPGLRRGVAQVGVQEEQVMRDGRAGRRRTSSSATAAAPVSIAAALPRLRGVPHHRGPGPLGHARRCRRPSRRPRR